MLAKKLARVIALCMVIAAIAKLQCCEKEFLVTIPNNLELKPRLSEYEVFQGNPSDLKPSAGFVAYELSTQLFTDYAEKQRLIKLPPGSTLQPVDDGLPVFPEGTILVKTFFYRHEKANPSSGKKIIETRLLIKQDGKWNVGTYKWNEAQNDATLLTTGATENVSWKDENGQQKSIAYHIPNNTECNTCHQSSGIAIPIGPKMRNLNRDVQRNGVINQLLHLKNAGVFADVDPTHYTMLPSWEDQSHTLEQRGRAYLDVNCAHCHSDGGVAGRLVFRPAYETPFDETYLRKYKKLILIDLEKKKMPKLGTTIVHSEAIELLRKYFETL